jgi:hypothetical protein
VYWGRVMELLASHVLRGVSGCGHKEQRNVNVSINRVSVGVWQLGYPVGSSGRVSTSVVKNGTNSNHLRGGESAILNRNDAHPNRVAVSLFCQGP